MSGSVVQSRGFSDPSGFGVQALEFAQFDPAQGALAGVRIEVSAEVAGFLRVENLESRAVSLSYVAQARIDVFAPGGVPLIAETLTGEEFVDLAAFDGISDFAGGSGTVVGVSASVEGVAGTAPGGTIDTAPFIGTGSVELVVGDVARNRIAGPANMRVSAEASVAGEVRLAYDTTPLPDTIDDGGGGGGVVVTNPTFSFPVVTATTAPQRFSFGARPTGWQEALPVARFDPALGTLLSVQLRLVSNLTATAWAENHGTLPASVYVMQAAVTGLTLDGGVLATNPATLERTLDLGAADGIDDFAGTGGIGEAGWAFHKAQAVTLLTPAMLAAFSGTGTVPLLLDSQGVGSIAGPASFLAEIAALSGAEVEVAYTYAVDAAMSAVLLDGGGAVEAEAYAGPVANLQHQFVSITPDSLVLAATTDNWFIRTGSGTDAIAARGGTNVIDGGGGSNFLTGGFGRDTFFIDLRDAAADVWSSVVNFQSGDQATIWGVTPAMRFAWTEDEGDPAARGLTLHATTPGLPTGSLTLAGYTTADLTNGTLHTSFGSIEGNDYIFIRAA